MESYVYIKDNIEVERKLDEVILIVEDKSKRRGESLYKINEDALKIISMMTGEYKLKEIIESLSKYYGESFDEIHLKLINFFNILEGEYKLKVIYSNEKIVKNIYIEGNNSSYYPSVVSIELTHKCNLKCLHCYGEYSVEDIAESNFDKLKKFLVEAKKAGIRIVELTGGEVTMYPHIVDVLKLIYDLNFKFVSILSNGVIRNEELYNLIIENKEKTIMQIDMHGNTDEYLSWFTKVSNIKEKVEDNIKYLHENGVLIRVVTVMTPKNLNQILDIAKWVHEAGIESYGISPVINIGRANEYTDELSLTNMDEYERFTNILNTISSTYGREFMQIIEDQRSLKENCGALASNISISPNGDLKICSMDSLEFTKTMGNVFEENIKDIFDRELDFIISYRNLKSPSPDTEGCNTCNSVGFCAGCILRGLIKGQEKGDECKWYTNVVPEIIKGKLLKGEVLV